MINFAARILRYFVCLLSALAPSAAVSESYRVYIDADFTTSFEVGRAIALGVRTAFAEVDFSVGGASLQIIDKNHKGSVKRSHRNLQNALTDSEALAVFGGMHSPPYLQHKDFINNSGLLTLLPWSAAGPITRSSQGTENWIFRLSVDDSKAGRFLVERAIKKQACSRPALVLIDTGWGRTNKTTMMAVLKEHQITPSFARLIPAKIGPPAAQLIAKNLQRADADCVILLAQAAEAAMISGALHDLDHPVQIYSHWAILGANYPMLVPHDVRQFLGLQVLQSCGLMAEANGSEELRRALTSAGSDLKQLSDIAAPAGFVHGYDLAKVFLAALEQAMSSNEWNDDIAKKRRAIKTALEDLQSEVPGVLKTYSYPFSPYSEYNFDAHEALGAQDLCMAEFDPDGRLRHVDSG